MKRAGIGGRLMWQFSAGMMMEGRNASMPAHAIWDAAGAKGGTNFTYWPRSRGPGGAANKFQGAEILVDEGTGFATGVLYHGPDGQVHEQRAEMAIMACNGVGTLGCRIQHQKLFLKGWRTAQALLVKI